MGAMRVDLRLFAAFIVVRTLTKMFGNCWLYLQNA